MTKDPIPESALPYNTTSRPRPKKWFRLFSAPKEIGGFYSPFWPLVIVFLSFIILLVYEVTFLRYRAITLSTQLVRLSDGVQKANAQNTFVQGLRSDLETLAPTNSDAALLLKEFFPPVSAASVDPIDAPKTPDAPVK